MVDDQQALWNVKLLQEMRAVERRDLSLWLLGLMILLVVAAGFAALVFPNLVWGTQNLKLDSRYLPQLFYGFIALILLFSLYALDKKMALRHAHDELMHQLIRSEEAEMAALKDPLTDTFNRRYFDQIIQGEVNRAVRRRTGLAVIMIDLDDFKSVNTRFGHLVGDQVLVEAAQMLRATFRSCDIVLRYGGDEFLVIITDGDESRARVALERLRQSVDAWNRQEPIPGYQMGLSCGVAAYAPGSSIQEMVEAADDQMFVEKHAKRAGIGEVPRPDNAQAVSPAPAG